MKPITIIRLLGQTLLLLSIIFYALLIIHDFFGYTDTYPYLGVDDGLANVSYSLAKKFRYGFLSSPLQGGTYDFRHKGFFNYGPWYFFLGAGLIWLFGYSVALLRSIHLFIILSIIIISYIWFKGKDGKIAAGFSAILLLHCFDSVQWPMVRSDIMVSLFAILFIVSSGLAIKDRKPFYWFLSGMFAFCAALSHLIAWSLIVSCIIVFLIAQINNRKSNGKEAGNAKEWIGQAIKDFIMLLTGGLLSLLMFFGSFGFRFKEFFSFLNAYKGINVAHPGYLKVLSKHINVAFNYPLYNKPALTLVIVFSIIGLAIVILSLFLWEKDRKKILIYLFPPTIAGFLYMLSLGTYNNFHTGYVILLQVMGFWFMGATVYILFILNSHRSERLGTMLSISSMIILFVLMSQIVTIKLKTYSNRDHNAMNWVSITDYINKIIGPVHAGSSAWGTAMFGVENPERIQLIQFSEGVHLASKLSETDKKALAPEYIVWGLPENKESFLSVLKGDPVWLQNLSRLFPGYRYELVSMVAGEPYGITRIYQRKGISEPFSDYLPGVSIYNPAERQWSSSVGPLQKTDFKKTAPVKFQFGSYSGSPVRTANNTVLSRLETGDYLLKVTINAGKHMLQYDGMLCVTSVPEVKKTMTEFGPDDFDCGPYVTSDREAYLIHRHPGGEVYISQFDSSPDSGILRVDVYPVKYLRNRKQGVKESTNSLPNFWGWHTGLLSGVKKTLVEESGILIEGNDTQFGYQITSKPLEVHPYRKVTLRLPVKALQGNIRIGILDQSGGKWLVRPTKAGRETVFKSGKNKSFTVVISNNYENANNNVRSKFIIYPGSYSDWKDELYTDMLVNGVKHKGK